MKQYIVIGILTVVLIVLIALTTLLALNDFSIANIDILSIKGMQNKKQELTLKEAELTVAEVGFQSATSALQNAKDAYAASKNKYDAITDEQIETIKEATKEDHYYIDWLWIVVGEYAEENNLTLNVIDSRTGNSDVDSAQGTIKIKVLGRYEDIANFVFEIENDNELRFKLDNMAMEYSKDNKVIATFDVLSMEVLF
ncbi:MAG: hypothetical protein IKV94_04165 [Clostridia bacterium]|nr:hypothetical protein [Clostridia bacterium]